ncbi:MAG: diguanylate cyclase, partial [Cyanobacteria bacterium J06598_3]
LPLIACAALQKAACLGSQFPLADLALITGQPKLNALKALMPAIQEGFLVSLDDRYKLLLEGDTPATVKFRFQHDRVQQAAYALIEDGKKEMFHLQIGQALWKRETQPPVRQLSEKQGNELVQALPDRPLKETSLDSYHSQTLFEIVNHLNLGWALITTDPSLLELVRLNAQAGVRALDESAYEAAQAYFETGLRLLAVIETERGDKPTADGAVTKSTATSAGDNHYQLSRQMTLGAAKATFLLGEWTQMSRWIERAIGESRSVIDVIPAYELKIEAAHAKNQLTKGIELTLSTLQQLGLSFSTVPDPPKIGEALGLTAQEISERSLDEIVALPEMRSPQPLAIMRLITAIITPCFSAAPALLPLVVTAQVRLALSQGNTPSAVYAYAVYGLILSGIVGDFAGSYNMGQLSRQLLARYSGKAEGIRARTQHVLYAFIDHWHEPLTVSGPKLLANYELGLETGDFEYAVLSAHVYCLNCFLTGQELSGLAQEMEMYSEVMRQLKRSTTLNFQTVWHQSVLNLLGESPSPSKLQGAVYDIVERLPVHQARQDATALLIAYFHQALLSYWFGEGKTALHNIQQSADYLQGVPGLPIVPAWHFYSALIHLDQAGGASDAEKVELLTHVDEMITKLQGWSAIAPDNHEHRIALIQAEKARVLGDVGAAMAYYDTAIERAQSLGYIHERALANERAALFYQGRGNQKIGQLYLKEARSAYTRWGALAKLKDLEQRYPTLAGPTAQPNRAGASPWTTTETDSEQLDVMSVLKASQALASDIQLDKLLPQLMTLVLENAGAEKGYLVTFQQERWCIEAIATVQGGVMAGHLEADVATQVPIGLLNYVLRTQKSVVLKNAAVDEAFGHDPYIQQTQPLSVLCLPLVNQGKLNGIIYLENNLMADAFTRDRLTVLQLLSSQAAISLDNAQLYRQLQQYSRTLEDRVAERTIKLEEANQELQRQTTVDGLTQITNRRGFDQALQSNWKHLARAQQPISLLLCDVDYFKAYNDRYGHLEGDRCLQRIAQALQVAAKRQTDTVARYGGEEFALILPETTPAAAICLAEKVLRQVRDLKIPHAASSAARWVTLSIGVASCLPDFSSTPEKLISTADQALYAAKSAGRNGYRT